MTIDRKFIILAVNPINQHYYTAENSLLLCAKDAAVPAALRAYRNACEQLGCDRNHILSVELLIERVEQYQKENGSKIADTIGAELDRCIYGIGIDN